MKKLILLLLFIPLVSLGQIKAKDSIQFVMKKLDYAIPQMVIMKDSFIVAPAPYILVRDSLHLKPPIPMKKWEVAIPQMVMMKDSAILAPASEIYTAKMIPIESKLISPYSINRRELLNALLEIGIISKKEFNKKIIFVKAREELSDLEFSYLMDSINKDEYDKKKKKLLKIIEN